VTQTSPLQVSRDRAGSGDCDRLQTFADAPVFSVFQQLRCSPRGLTEAEAAERLSRYGDNEPCRPTDDDTAGTRLIDALRSPFVALLSALSMVFVVAGDIGGAVTIAVMVILAVLLRFWQQTRSTRAIHALRQFVTSTVTVRRRASASDAPVEREVPG
jgi:Mg2+-importing ATPase